MLAVGLGVTWLGYSVFYYGLTQVQSGNWGLLDLMLPGRASTLADVPRDGSSAAGATSTSGAGPLSTSSLAKDIVKLGRAKFNGPGGHNPLTWLLPGA